MGHFDLRHVLDAGAAFAALVAGAWLLVAVFPEQIPEGLGGDVSSGHYPWAIMVLWICSAAAWLVLCVLPTGGEAGAGVDRRRVGRTAVLVLTVGVGFLLFVNLGFIVAAAFLIASLSALCGERGPAPWILAVAAPVLIRLFLDTVLEVRLPSVLWP